MKTEENIWMNQIVEIKLNKVIPILYAHGHSEYHMHVHMYLCISLNLKIRQSKTSTVLLTYSLAWFPD